MISPALFSVRAPTVFQHCLTLKRTRNQHFFMRAFMRAFLLCSSIFLRAFLLCSSTFCLHCLHAFLLCSSTFFCARPYCIPALPHAEKDTKAALFCVHFSSVPALSVCTVCMHFYYVPAFFCVHFYFAPALFLCAFLLCSSTFCACSREF